MMIQVDKLMKSNELNFQLFALFPFGLVCYTLYLIWISDKTNKKVIDRIQSIFRETHVLLNSKLIAEIDHNNVINPASPLYPIDYGRLIISLWRLNNASSSLGKSRIWFQNDLLEIETETYSIQQRLNTMDRMYRTYQFLQREK
jgi:hypothetical protein